MKPLDKNLDFSSFNELFERESVDLEREKIERLACLYDGDEINTLFRSKKLYFDKDTPVHPGLPDGCPRFTPQRN